MYVCVDVHIHLFHVCLKSVPDAYSVLGKTELLSSGRYLL